MLEIKNLSVKTDKRVILQGVNLEVGKGEVHVIMGPNGSGKSTLANVLVGKVGYEITGQVFFEGEPLLTCSPEERSGKGVFLSFQYPTEIAGINNLMFLKTAVNALRKRQKKPILDSMDLINLIKQKGECLALDENFLKRPLNAGLSGGEKKRNEILQMLVLDPKLAILDEPDSGLDVDALKLVGKGINQFRSANNAIILITHYQRLLELIKPDFVHILHLGKIVKTGTQELAQQIEQTGYSALIR